MASKPKKPPVPLETLLPERYPETELFFCDVADAVLKDIIPHLEHPFYTLSKMPDHKERRYVRNHNWLEIRPGSKGLPTIYDKDILIYAISQLMAKLNRGEKVSKKIRLDAYDYLRFTNRGTGGRDYDALIDSLNRLDGVRIATNIETGSVQEHRTFGLIESTYVQRTKGLTGRIQWIELTLSDWVFNAIQHQEVLTLSRDYFRLRRPLERRLYEMARKHCGSQKEWRVSLDTLFEKSGSAGKKHHFRHAVREIVDSRHLPDYDMELDGEFVVFRSRGSAGPVVIEPVEIPQLDGEVYELARDIVPGWDIHMIEQEWRAWATEAPKSPEMAFLGFCRSWAKSRGQMAG